ncbi:MAG TPA: GNAT family N-acetyltransferase [Ktedonobacterales bacterium]|jgi:GNAT superfamily N-acetyltransferase
MDTVAISYRLATLDDLGTLAELRWELDVGLHGVPDAPSDARALFATTIQSDLRAGMDRGTVLVWLAEMDGHAVGCAQLTWWPVPKARHPDRKRGYVTGVYTRPEYRRRGVARQLIELLSAYARDHAITRLLLSPSPEAVPLYRSLGFVPSHGLELNL